MILALECSTSLASLGLFQGRDCIFSASWAADRNLDASLFPHLENALTFLKGKRLEVILVGAGPGSYGSVRVALAAASGIALALHSNVVSLSSWEALNIESDCLVFSDARRNAWGYAQLVGGFLKSEISVTSQEELLRLISKNEHVLSIETQEHLSLKGVEHVRSATPTAEGLLCSWLRRNESEQETLRRLPTTPIYVCPPHITQSKRLPWATALSKG